MLKIAWVSLWLITPSGQSTTIVQYIPEGGDPMARCEKTLDAMVENTREFGNLQGQRFYLVCTPVYVQDGAVVPKPVAKQ